MLAFGNIFLQEARHAPQDKVGSLLARGLECYTKASLVIESLRRLWRCLVDFFTSLWTHSGRCYARKCTMFTLPMELGASWLSEGKLSKLRIFS